MTKLSKIAGAAGTGATGYTIYDIINNPDALMGLLEAIKAVPFKEGGPARQPVWIRKLC